MTMKPWPAPYCPRAGDSDPRMVVVWCAAILLSECLCGIVAYLIW